MQISDNDNIRKLDEICRRDYMTAREERQKQIWGAFCRDEGCTWRTWKPMTYYKASWAMDHHNLKHGLEGHPTKVVLYTELPTYPKPQETPVERVSQGCGICKGIGHNSRTCPEGPNAKPKTESPEPKKRGGPKPCKTCGEMGHNSRTCGREKVPKKVPSKTRGCTRCGQPGHYAKTCTVDLDALQEEEALKQEMEEKLDNYLAGPKEEDQKTPSCPSLPPDRKGMWCNQEKGHDGPHTWGSYAWWDPKPAPPQPVVVKQKRCAFERGGTCPGPDDNRCAAYKDGICLTSTARWDPLTKSYCWVKDIKPFIAPYCGRGEFFMFDDTVNEVDLTDGPNNGEDVE